MTNFIISRVGFCKHCYKASKPSKDDIYILFGTNHQAFEAFECKHDTPEIKRGFVPFLWEKLAVQSMDSGMYVHTIKTCSICGVEINYTQDKKLETMGTIKRVNENGKEFKLYIQRIRWTKTMLPVKEWNALVNFKGTGYELDDWKYQP